MKNLANIITTIRALLSIVAIIFLSTTPALQITAIVLIPIVMILDIFDGMAARLVKSDSINGSVYDILADRMIEFSFFVFFASLHVCSFWAALIIIWRGLTLDAIRGIALRQGKTTFGKISLHDTRWAKLLTDSRLSRGTYNTLKTIAFMIMALQLYNPSYAVYVSVIVWVTVSWSILRAIPVMIDGYPLLKTEH